MIWWGVFLLLLGRFHLSPK